MKIGKPEFGKKNETEKDPKINGNKKKKWIALGLTVVLVGGIASTYASKAIAGNTEEITTYTEMLTKQDVVKTVTVSGTLQSENSDTLVSSVTDTTVKSIEVQVGDTVKEGDVIAVLDDTSLQNQLENAQLTLSNTKKKSSLDVSTAQSNYNSAVTEQQITNDRNTASVNEAQTAYNNAVTNQSNKNNEYNQAVSNRVAAENAYNSAVNAANSKKAIYDAAKTAYEGADSTAENYESLKSAYETASAEYSTATTAVSTAETALSDARTKESEAKAALDSANESVSNGKSTLDKANETKADGERSGQKSVEESKTSLSQANISASESSLTPEEEVAKLEKQIEACTIKATRDGVVTAILVKEGANYKGEDVATIQDPDNMVISAVVDQYQIGSLLTGQSADVTVAAATEDTMEGEVTFVSPTPKESSTSSTTGSTTTTGTDYEIKVKVKNVDSRFRSGMTAKAVITVQEEKNVFAVSDSCIQTDTEGNYFVEVKDGETTKQITVTKGLSTDAVTVIEGDGLEEGMEVVIPTDISDGTTTDSSFY